MDTALIERLCAASREKFFLPERDVDWSLRLDAQDALVPDEAISLHGLPEFDALDGEARRTLARHEVAAFFSFAMRLENVLMRNFSRLLYGSDPLAPWVEYYLHEVEEEARHNRMFQELIRWLGTGSYPLSGIRDPAERALGMATRSRPLFLLLTLGSEMLPDYLVGQIITSPTTHPLIRRVGAIHQVEEARHIAFGQAHFADLFAAAGPSERAAVRHLAPYLVRAIFDGFATHEAYLRSGVSRSRARAWALWYRAGRSPHRRALRRRAVGRLAAFLEEVGVIDASTRWHWRSADLLATG